MKRGIDYIGVGIGAAIFNNQRKIFLSKRGHGAQNEVGKWELPGGALEFGESFEETIVREIQEEFGFQIQPLDWLEPYNHLVPQEHQHWVALCFICKVVSGIPKILESDKSIEIGWFTEKEMEAMDLALPSKRRLVQLKEKFPHGFPNLY